MDVVQITLLGVFLNAPDGIWIIFLREEEVGRLQMLANARTAVQREQITVALLRVCVVHQVIEKFEDSCALSSFDRKLWNDDV